MNERCFEGRLGEGECETDMGEGNCMDERARWPRVFECHHNQGWPRG
jgi:hypothetical protein